MNYLLTFANLLKSIYITAYPRYQVSIPVKVFAKNHSSDRSQMWMTSPVNSALIEEQGKNQNNSADIITQPPDVSTNMTEGTTDVDIPKQPSVLKTISDETQANPTIDTSSAASKIAVSEEKVEPEIEQVSADNIHLKSEEELESEVKSEMAQIQPAIEDLATTDVITEATTLTFAPLTEAQSPVAKPVAESVQQIENKEEMPKRPSGWVTIQLKQQVTLANLSELHDELQQLLGKRVQLSGSQVQRVDTAALQLLLAFMHCSEVSVCWTDHSPALRQAAQLLGLSTLLSLPE